MNNPLHHGVPYGYDMVEFPSYPSISESTNLLVVP